MEDWLASLKSGSDIKNVLSGQHTWHATSHARPTYCNVCREQLSGVTSHGLNCEICKYKVHKRCALKAINNCKWTTLSSVGKEIIEDRHGNILMPHQWMEGNLPVSAKCAVCEKTCGSVLRLQDWRCLWCRATTHTACRPKHSTVCPLGPNRISVVPPTAIHSIGVDEAWEAVRPQGCSPLLVFVNSKSGDNQGVKFLKRFRQILNPAQVFDLITNGPGLGLRLFRHFDPFRVLICSGDGSVGWVLSEIDRLNMQLQCEVGVLPLGTGNDLARVLGWGASCDDDSQVPQLLERYERASRKILDRWSVMVFERSLNVGDGGKLTINTTALVENNNLVTTAVAYEDSVLSHITKILQSDKHSVVIASARILCETVKDFSTKISEVSLTQGDTDFSEKCQQLELKLDHLLQTLNEEQQHANLDLQQGSTELSVDRIINGNEKHSYEIAEREKRPKKELLLRVNSLKKAVRSIVEHTERAVDEQNMHSQTSGLLYPSSPGSRSATSSRSATTVKEMTVGEKLSPCSTELPNLESISPLPDIRRDSTFSADIYLESLPVPSQFADSRHGSFAETGEKDRIVPSTASDLATTGDDVKTTYRCTDYTEEWLNRAKIKCDQHNDGGKHNVLYFDVDHHLEEDEDYDDSVLLLDKELEESSSISFRVSEELLAKMGHIDSSETSDESPESSTVKNQIEIATGVVTTIVSATIVADAGKRSSSTDEIGYYGTRNRSSLQDSVKDSEPNSYPISIDGMCNVGGSELDLTNLFSTSPEDEECSEEYRREMGLASSTVKRCSIAHFIEGSDIARKSVKCRHRKKSVEELEMECVAVNTTPLNKQKNNNNTVDDDSLITRKKINQPSSDTNASLEIPSIRVSLENGGNSASRNVICGGGGGGSSSSVGGNGGSNSEIRSEKDLINIRIRGSHNNLALSVDGIHLSSDKSSESHSPMRISCALSETDDDEYLRFKGLTRSIANSSSTGPTVIIDPPSPPATDAATDEHDDMMNVDEKPSQEHLSRRLSAASPLTLHCSPSPSRRISNFSLLQSETTDSAKESPISKKPQKKLPIINPLVRLPQWPDVAEPGIIGKVLLANADALCAAAVPLIDPDEILMEGFFERCVMNNYFGIGIDAKISLDFHHKREEHPEKCRSRTRNYMWYGVLGSKQWLQKTYKNLEQRVQLECDGHRIPLPSLQGIVVLNIPSFMGGINFWGGTKEDDIFLAPSIDDRILEVVAVFGTVQMAASRLINLQHHRIAQCTTVQINIMGEEGVPIQVDGEAWIQPPGMIRIIHKNRMRMLCRNKALENSLKTWEEKQKQLRQQSRLHSTVIGKLNLFTDEEYSLLLGFIEVTAALIKSVKLLIISHPKIEADLYELAATVSINMEKVHPSGKILPAVALRPAVTDLVVSAQKLYEETCVLLRDKSLQIESNIENQLNSTLSQMDLEFKKCSFIETAPDHSVVYLRLPSPDEQEKKSGHRKGSAFWQKFRRGSGVSATKYNRKDVALWGVTEVGNWLESLQLSDYVEAFASHDVRGRELLTLTRRDLKELGVTKVGHVKRILLALKDLAT